MTVLPDAVGMAPEGREHLLPYADLNFQSMGPPGVLREEAERRAGGAREYVAWQVRREALAPDGGRVQVVRAELGTAAGLIGAGLVAFDAAAAR